MRRRTFILLPVLGTIVVHAGLAAGMWWYGNAHALHYSAARPPAPRQVPTPPEPIYIEEPQVIPPKIESVWGEASGAGEAINSAEGFEPQAGPEGFQDQAASSPDAGRALPKQEERMARPPGGGFKVPSLPGRTPTLPEPAEQEGEDPTHTEPAQEAEQARPQSDGGENKPPGESAIDASTTVREATFRNGAVDARFGRRFRLAPAQYFLSMRDEVGFAKFPIVVRLTITLDDEGNVLDVLFRQRSPSPSLDRTIELTLYSSWFEPVEGEPTFDANFVFTR